MRLIEPCLGVGSLRLRRWRTDDAPALAAGWTDPDVAASSAVPAVATPEAARCWIDGWDDRADAGLALDLVIGPPSADRSVWGEIGLGPIDWPEGTAEIGYWVVPDQRRRRVATTAVDLLTTWALATLPLRHIVARVPTAEAASARVLVGAGFLRRGRLRSGHDLWARSSSTPTRSATGTVPS